NAVGPSGDRGRSVTEPSRDAGVGEAGEHLRSLVLDPLVPSLGGAKRLVVALDDALHLVPLGALPLKNGVVAKRYEIELRTTLKEITITKRSPWNPSVLIAMGGVDYDASTRENVTLLADATHSDLGSGARGDLVSPGHPALEFRPLPETRSEAHEIAR